MTIEEFNDKYKDHLEPGHYGLDINNPDVIQYLDLEFKKEIERNPGFRFAQIKLKFNYARMYTNSGLNHKWEEAIDRMLNNT